MGKPLVIIADPNNSRADAIRDAFNGYVEIQRIRDPHEAYAEIRSLKPAAVVVDFPFPLNGRCLSNALRDDPITAHIPIIAFSGWDFPRTRAKAEEYGCDCFVSYAQGPEGVIEAVRSVISLKASA